MFVQKQVNGYEVRFLAELKGGKGCPETIPFEIQGTPALIHVMFRFFKKGTDNEKSFVHSFSAPIQRPGWLYSFPAGKTTGRKPVLKGKVQLPHNLKSGEPFELDVEVSIRDMHEGSNNN